MEAVDVLIVVVANVSYLDTLGHRLLQPVITILSRGIRWGWSWRRWNRGTPVAIITVPVVIQITPPSRLLLSPILKMISQRILYWNSLTHQRKRIKKHPPELLRDKEENKASFYATKVIMLDLQNQCMFILCAILSFIIISLTKRRETCRYVCRKGMYKFMPNKNSLGL